MLDSFKIRDVSLNEYVSIDFNRAFYKFFHEVLNRKYGIDLIDFKTFFDESYMSASIYYHNYEKLGYDVDQFMIQKCAEVNDDNVVIKGFQVVFVESLILQLTEENHYNSHGKKIARQNEFVRGEFWSFGKGLGIVYSLIENYINKISGEKVSFGDLIDGFYKRLDEDYYLNVNSTEKLLEFFSTQFNQRNLIEGNLGNIEPLDLGDSSASEKIIYLYKLGVLDYLKTLEPFKASTNALAEYISAITGENPKTIQSYINPIDNKMVSQNNNPLLREKTVKKVNNRLIEIGFNTLK